MAGYTRQSTFADGDTITAALFNNEYNQLLNAFSNTSGHKHDGTANEGPVIGLIGDAGVVTPLNKVLIDSTNDHIEFWVDVSSSSVQQLYIADGAIVPVTDSDIDLGTTSLRFKDTYTDTVTTTGNVSIGGNLTVTGDATISGNLTFGDADTDSINLAAEIDSDIIPNTDGTYDLGSATKEWQDLYIDGTANIDSLVADTADINGGTIDGATIATSDITVGAGKTLNVSAGTLTLADNQISGDKVEGGTIAATTITTLASTTGNITTVNSTTTNATTVDSTNLEVTNLKAKDGTAAGSIADSTGVVTLGSSVLTTTDINGGTIDGVTIGGTSAGAVTFTDLSDGTITIAGFADEDDMSSDSATLVPTQQSVKAYVDSQVTAQDLDFQGDTGGALSIDLDSESLTIAGGTGLDTVGSGNTVTVNIDSTVATLTGTQTLTNKTLTSPDVNTPDIDGGTIDGTVIGGATPAAGTFTTLTANTSITGTLATAAQPNITSLGTLTGLNVAGTPTFDGLTVDGNAELVGNALSFDFMESDQTDKNLRLRANGGVFSVQTLSDDKGTQTNRLQVSHTTGDISFYEDTGTSQALFWDASAESLGVGTTSPASAASLHLKGAGGTELHMESGDGASTSIIKHNQSANSLEFTPNSSAGKILDILGTGIDVTGTATMDGLTVDGNILAGTSTVPTGLGASNTKLILSNDSDSPEIVVYRNTNVISAGDKVGAYLFGNDDNNATEDHFAGIWAKSSGTGGHMDIYFAGGRDNYENDTSQMVLTNDGNVGIGSASPDSLLHLHNTSQNSYIHMSGGGSLGETYGGFIRGYGVSGEGGHLELGVFDNTTKRVGIEITEQGNEVIFDTAGTERMRINSSGNVGIGTTSPDAMLRIDQDAIATGLKVTGGSGGAVLAEFTRDVGSTGTIAINSLSGDPQIKFASASNTFSIGANSTTFEIADNDALGTNARFTINSVGNVGIGTTSPTRVFEVNSGTANAVARFESTDSRALIEFKDNAGTASIGNIGTNLTFFPDNATESMRIDSSGNVNIGTTAASSGSHKLVVESASTTGTVNSHIALIGDSATIGQGPQILFSEAGDGEAYAGGTIGFTRTGSNSIGDLVFGTRGSSGDANTTTTERMRINSSGQVSIGTTTAEGGLLCLDTSGNNNRSIVIGRSATDDASKSSALSILHYNNGSEEPVCLVGAGIDDDTNNTVRIGGGFSNLNSATILDFYTAANNDTTTGTVRMRITATGAIGFGTTPPSDTHTGWNQFFIGQKGSLISENATGTHGLDGMFITDNLYVDSDTGSLANIETNQSSAYRQEAGVHHFYSQASGSAGAAVTLSEKMRIDSLGNLLVGTTSTAFRGNHTIASTDNFSTSIVQTRTSAGASVLNLDFSASTPNNTTDYFIFAEDASATRFIVRANGNVENVNNSYGALSDEKLKENIVDATDKLEDLKQVKVRNYNLIGNDKKQIGVIAQELETIFPNMVEETPDLDDDNNDLGTTTKSVKYSVFIPILIKAIQEQQAQIEALQSEINELKNS